MPVVHDKSLFHFILIMLKQQQHNDMLQKLQVIHGYGVVDLAQEEDAPSRALQDEDQEGSAKFDDSTPTIGRDLECCGRHNAD